MLKKGDIIGAYEIVAPLGQGGMATVYKAYHARLNRNVAIKMIHQAYLDDPNFLARFEREAQIVAGLEHPHIIPVYDFSEHEGEPYLVMKLIEGSTLKALLAKGALPVEDILAIVEPVADALDYAHGMGVLHRDIKPSNIMLDQKAVPFLTDFGLARLSQSGATTLSQDFLLGTPYYMSPEQGAGKGEIDFRADLYSFGVVLYELLVGKVPFSEGTPYAIIADHIQRVLPLPTSLNPDIPPAIEAVLLQSLAKEPDDRYQSADAMVSALRSAVRAAPQTQVFSNGRHSAAEVLAVAPDLPHATPQPKSPSARRLSRRIGLLLLALGLLVVVLATALVIWKYGTTLVPLQVEEVATVAITLTPPTAESPPPPTIPPIDVPPMTADQARAAILSNPDDPAGYLALARSQLQAKEDGAARQTLADGLSHVPDTVRFEMTAADLAVQIGRYDAAFSIYSTVLVVAQGQPTFAAVRETAGAFLYNAATLAGRLTLAEVTGLDAELRANTSPIVSAMIARAFLTSNMARFAKASIDKALLEDATLPEVHLVNGELLEAQSNPQQARAEWQAALGAPDAPQWVRVRANQLMNSLT